MKTCSIEGCNEKYWGLDLCKTHYNSQYYKENKSKIDSNNKEWKKRNPNKAKEWKKIRVDDWGKLIPQETTCQVCGKTIYYHSGNKTKSIHFDHRHEGNEAIKIQPVMWLRMHKRNDKNEKIWKSCDFGMLCDICNRHLMTRDRKDYLLKQIKYVFGEEFYNKLLSQ